MAACSHSVSRIRDRPRAKASVLPGIVGMTDFLNDGTRYLAALRMYLYIQNEPKARRTKRRREVILASPVLVLVCCSTRALRNMPLNSTQLPLIEALVKKNLRAVVLGITEDQ